MQVEIVNQMLSVIVGRGQGEITVEKFMGEKLLLPKGFVQKCILSGQVQLQSKVAGADDILRSGQRLWLHGDWLKQGSQGDHMDENMIKKSPLCSVLYEDDHILVVNKPAGLIVHSDGRPEMDSLDKRVKSYYAKTGQLSRILHVHRLDQGTTGTLLYSKHGFIARALDEELRSHQIKRTYLAITFGSRLARAGVFNGAIGRDRHISGKYRVSQTGKQAVTVFQRLAERRVNDKTLSLVACQLKTGRTHQIRVHFSNFGAPIIGDELYEGKMMAPFTQKNSGFGLHAFSLKFYHPYEEMEMTIHSPLPPNWNYFFQQWGWHVSDDEQFFTN